MTRTVLINAPIETNRYYSQAEIACWRYLHLLRYQLQFRTFLSPTEFLELENIKNQHYGLLSLASSLLAAGYEASYQVPLAYSTVGFADLLSAEIVGISSMTSTFSNALRIAQFVKENSNHTKILIGGHHAQYQYQEILASGDQPFHIIVGGFSETRLVRLLEKLLQGKDNISDIAGLAYRDKAGNIVFTGTPELLDLNQIPLPAVHLIPGKLIGARVHTAYGCPYRCAFCQLGGAKARHYKSIQNLREELITLKEQKGTKLVYIGNPTFGGDLHQVQQISKLMNDLELHWQFQTRVNLVRQPLLEILAKDRFFCGLELGIESSSELLIRKANKHITPRQGNEAINLIVNMGLNLLTYWIFGLPGMTPDMARRDFERMVTLVQQGVLVHLNMMVPYPGSQYFQSPSEFGLRLESFDWREYYAGGYPVYSLVEPQLSRDQLFDLYSEGVLALSEAVEGMVDPSVKAQFSDFGRITVYRGLF